MLDPYENMSGFPVMLQLGLNWRGLIVGGGAVAYRRFRSLTGNGDITVIAPEVDPRFKKYPANVILEKFDPARHSLTGYRVVVAATDDVAVNDAIASAVRAMDCPPLLNRADKHWRDSDISFMSAHHDGPITVGVHTDGVSAYAGTGIRDEIARKLDPAWAVILTLAAPYRSRITLAATDPQLRRKCLLQLSDKAMRTVYAEGGASAVRERLDAIMERLA